MDYKVYNMELDRLSLPNPFNYIDLDSFSSALVMDSSLELLDDGHIVYSCCGWS